MYHPLNKLSRQTECKVDPLVAMNMYVSDFEDVF